MADEDVLVDDGADSLLQSSDVADSPGLSADPITLVRSKIPERILAKYEVHSYRSAIAVLSESNRGEFEDILTALDTFSLTTEMIRKPGGNESEIPKHFSAILRPNGWNETAVQGDLLVRKRWKEYAGLRAGKAFYDVQSDEYFREKFLDGHKIDYVKRRVALDLEWNSKDQTFDRDLYAFNAFSVCGVIDVGVIVTRSAELNRVFRMLGPALNRDGKEETKRSGGKRMTLEKYGASTTWMGKLLYRLNAGRNGGCPVLAVGIRPECISDWEK